jgi:hypothetical protein
MADILTISVFVTVPHGLCINTYENVCDQSSLDVGNELHDHLVSNDVNSTLYVPGIHRSVVDMNRYPSRTTSYRKRLTNDIKDKRPYLLIDIHSYPDKYSWSNVLSFEDFVILLPEDVKPLDNKASSALSLVKYLQKNLYTNHSILYFKSDEDAPVTFVLIRSDKTKKIYGGILMGSRNDIINQCTNELGIDSFLLEVNDSISSSKRSKLINGIGDWILQ